MIKKERMMLRRLVYLKKLFDFKDKPFIKVVTGIRRCGKSTLLKMFIDEIQGQGAPSDNILQMNFEDLKYDGMNYRALNDYVLSRLPQSGKFYVFLDEIQRVPQWEKTVNSLFLNEQIDLYLTGSNAWLLSSELSTYLSGRSVEIKMLPLSFKEFQEFYSFPTNKSRQEIFSDYVRFGGMPSLAECGFDETQVRQVLDGIYNTVLMKDVLARNDVRDVSVLQKLVSFLADNVGNITSVNKITQVLVSEKSLSSQNNKLIEKYVSLLENAFVFYRASRYDIKGKDYLRNLEKYYIVDSGLKNHLVSKVTDTGRILENIVYLELLRRDYKVGVGKVDDKEVDFVAMKGNDKKYFQVCESFSEEATRNRELRPLQSIKDSFEKIVLTLDSLYAGITDDGVKIVNLIDWLEE